MPRIVLTSVARLTDRAVLRVEYAGYAPFAVYRCDGDYFVTDDVCSHGAAALSEGELAGHEILCPHHRGGFDIRSGAPSRAPCAVAIKHYPVTIAAGALFIDVD